MIENYVDLFQFAANVNNLNGCATGKYFKPGKDIEDVGLWFPMGTPEKPFTGSFDFSGYSVSGVKMTIETRGFADIGFFGCTSGAVITDSKAPPFRLKQVTGSLTALSAVSASLSGGLKTPPFPAYPRIR